MIALRRSDVRHLNDRARALMRECGRLGRDELRVGERDFAVGDHVVALKNAPRLDVVNGTRGVVTRIDERAGGLAVRTTDRRELELSRDYLESQTERGGPTLDHAITGHKAQGMTTDCAFVLGSDELYREWGYVAMSRGRVENRLYVVAAATRERDEYAPAAQRRDPLDRMRTALDHSRAQTAAIEQMDAGRRGEAARLPGQGTRAVPRAPQPATSVGARCADDRDVPARLWGQRRAERLRHAAT